MSKQYFDYLPDFAYVSREPDSKISDYITLKNIFRRIKLTDQVLNDITNFTKYKIIGDERPDQVAYKLYGDSNLDWLVMLANNTLNQFEEWPMSQTSQYNYLIKKYGTEENLSLPHHYETEQVKDNNNGVVIVKKGITVPKNYTVQFLSGGSIITLNPVTTISNYEYEEKIQTNRRNIYVLKGKFVSLALDLIKKQLINLKGSSQYQSVDLSIADNIKLYQ
jgi:hypothetical protein|tara:strand:+ start:5390 stop:6052 length:663 start_codon:yes stop_codon:yes gene_type:complete